MEGLEPVLENEGTGLVLKDSGTRTGSKKKDGLAQVLKNGVT